MEVMTAGLKTGAVTGRTFQMDVLLFTNLQ